MGVKAGQNHEIRGKAKPECDVRKGATDNTVGDECKAALAAAIVDQIQHQLRAGYSLAAQGQSGMRDIQNRALIRRKQGQQFVQVANALTVRPRAWGDDGNQRCADRVLRAGTLLQHLAEVAGDLWILAGWQRFPQRLRCPKHGPHAHWDAPSLFPRVDW